MPPAKQLQRGLDALAAGDLVVARRLLAPFALAGDPQAGIPAAHAALAMGEPRAAEFIADRLTDAPLNDTQASQVARVLGACLRHDKAERYLTRLANANPGWTAVRIELLALHLSADNDQQARQVLEQLRQAGVDADTLTRLEADVLRASGMPAQAMALYRAAAERSPDDPLLAEVIAFLSCADGSLSAAESADLHRRFGRALSRAAGPARFPHPTTDDPERPLTVGFLSDNFAAHSVAHFLTAPLLGLDRASFRVVGFYTNPLRDGVTERLAAMCDRFVHAPGLDDLSLARAINQQKVDVLIELNGLTQGHRLGAVALRPAPLQVTWLGYPSTTGLPSIDARIVDSITDPPGSEALATERLVHIDPCFVCYTPLPTGHPPLPRTPGGPPVFGSLNHSTKITEQVVALWARLVGSVPGAQLVLKARGLSSPYARRHIAERFAAHGLSGAALTVLPHTPTVTEHLQTYRHFDVLLDTFPYNGATTTAESLLMGVPVVTLAGDRHAARVGATMLAAAGCAQWVARSPEHYVQIATGLIEQRHQLAEGRISLATAVAASLLCDQRAFAQRFGAALRALWRERCTR